MIDKMFQQEVVNAELRKTSPFSFWIHDTVRMCFPRYGKHFFLPHNYMPPEQCGGDILHKIMVNDNHIDITDEDIDNISLYKKYIKKLKHWQVKNWQSKTNDDNV